MSQIKKMLNSTFHVLFMIYFIGNYFAAPYFTYQEIKRSDSVLKAIFVAPVIGVFKSPIWPYYAFKPSPTKLKNKSLDALMHASIALQEVKRISGEVAISKDPKKYENEMSYWMNLGEKILLNSSEAELEEIYVGLGQAVAILKEGIKITNSSLQNKVQVPNEGRDLLFRYDTWMFANSEKLSKKLKTYTIEDFPELFRENAKNLEPKEVATKLEAELI